MSPTLSFVLLIAFTAVLPVVVAIVMIRDDKLARSLQRCLPLIWLAVAAAWMAWSRYCERTPLLSLFVAILFFSATIISAMNPAAPWWPFRTAVECRHPSGKTRGILLCEGGKPVFVAEDGDLEPGRRYAGNELPEQARIFVVDRKRVGDVRRILRSDPAWDHVEVIAG